MSSEPGNRIKLRTLMAQHDLSNQDVADLLDRSINTVNQWTSTHPIEIPDQNLELLELKLQQRNKG